jgi:hypothetical protein
VGGAASGAADWSVAAGHTLEDDERLAGGISTAAPIPTGDTGLDDVVGCRMEAGEGSMAGSLASSATPIMPAERSEPSAASAEDVGVDPDDD